MSPGTRRRRPANPRKANGARRRAVTARVMHEEDSCHLCGGYVDTTLPPHQPGSPEIDEIIPVSKGGSPVNRKNCRLAHRACNNHRSNQDLHVYLARRRAENPGPLPTVTSETTRNWW